MKQTKANAAGFTAATAALLLALFSVAAGCGRKDSAPEASTGTTGAATGAAKAPVANTDPTSAAAATSPEAQRYQQLMQQSKTKPYSR